MILFIVLVILILITTFTEHFIDTEINQCPLQILKQKDKYTMINDRNKFYIPNQNPKVVNNIELLDISSIQPNKFLINFLAKGLILRKLI